MPILSKHHFKKWVIAGLFLFIFIFFSSKNLFILQQINVKKYQSQYTVMGFEPMTFGTLQFLQQINVKKCRVHPVNGDGIRTYNLSTWVIFHKQGLPGSRPSISILQKRLFWSFLSFADQATFYKSIKAGLRGELVFGS